jgi:hypothetical protein
MHENSNILSLTKEIDDPNAGSGQYIDVINLCNGHRGSLGGTQICFLHIWWYANIFLFI